MTDTSSSPVTSQRTTWRSPLFSALALALAVVIVAVTAYVLLREASDPDLGAGLSDVEIGTQVEGDDLVVVDTIQGVGVFVETEDGPAYVRYGDDLADRFGVGSVVDVEGEVAATTDLDESERERVVGDAYVLAEELEVDEQ